jgi:uncharacterized Zn ribbon protein
MSKPSSTHRILIYLLLSVIIVTVKILSQESSKDFKRLNIFHQKFEQSKEFRQNNVIKFPVGKNSFTDTLMRFPLLLNERSAMTMLDNVSNSQSDMYVVDTAISLRTTDTLRNTFTFNKDEKVIENLSEQWTNNQWVNNERYTYTYDANGNMLADLYEQWTNNQWVNNERDTYTYDANGNVLTYFLSEYWTNNQWENGTYYTYTYDTNRNMPTYLIEYWTNNQWENMERGTSTYDTNGNMLADLYERWTNNQWVEVARDTYTYDANGNMLVDLYEQCTNNQWVNDFRYTYTYDANGNMLVDLWEEWTNNQWVNDFRYTYTYDANGNMLVDLYEQWTNNQWVNDFRYTYKYFQNKLLSEGMCETWQNASWIPRNGSFSSRDNAGNSFYYSGYKISLTYKLITTGVSKDDVNTPKGYSLSQNYPNPFNPTTVIEFNVPKESYIKIVVSDVLGREIKTLVDENKSAGSFTVQFNANDLSSGIYFYQLQTKEFSLTKKLILMK